MTKFRTRIVTTLVVLLLPQWSLGQAVSELPRTEYYVAKEFFGAGRTIEATEGFQTAFAKARQIGDQRWIDSIPPLVMLGECYYQQGSLAAALEQYDAALMLAINHPGWINQLQFPEEQLPELERIPKGIDWFAKSQPTRSVAIPEALQLTLDPTRPGIDAGGINAPTTLLTRLDATEIIRTLGLAMLRRWEILGPLSKYSPLNDPLQKSFQVQPNHRALWVNAAWSLLRGMSQLPNGRPNEVRALVRSSVLLRNQFDYYLTPMSLLVLAELDARDGNYQSAIIHLQDATLLAAQYEQHWELATACELLADCAAASRRIEFSSKLQSIASWTSNQSLLAHLPAALGAAELSLLEGQPNDTSRLLTQAGNLLRNRGVSLIRSEADHRFQLARLAFSQGRSGLGISNLESALQSMHGSAQTGAVVPRVFQAQMTLDLLASNSLTRADAASLLSEILSEPGATQWHLDPLGTIATLTTASLPAYERWLELVSARADIDVLGWHIDRLQRQRLYEALPLAGRLLSWRMAAAADPTSLPDEIKPLVQSALQGNTSLASSRDTMRDLVGQLRTLPVPLDEKTLPADAKRAFADLMQQAELHENQLALEATSRKPLFRFQPEVKELDEIQSTLDEKDLMLSFAKVGQNFYCLAIGKESVLHWQFAANDEFQNKLTDLLSEIGLVRQLGQTPPPVFGTNAPWKTTSSDLAQIIFPGALLQKVSEADRLILVPNERLWYVPFELLPLRSDPTSARWIEGRSITYLPTTGSVQHAFVPHPTPGTSVGVVGDLFTRDNDLNSVLVQQLADLSQDSHQVMISPKPLVPSATWLALRAQQLWLATRLNVMPSTWETAVIPMGANRSLSLAALIESPLAAPDTMVLPGLVTSMNGGQLTSGNDVFLPVCAATLTGNRTAVISRWSTGGLSSHAICSRYLLDATVDPASDALRRATLALWTEQLPTKDEPSLYPTAKDAPPLISGEHPLLWAGYMSAGDHQPIPHPSQNTTADAVVATNPGVDKPPSPPTTDTSIPIPPPDDDASGSIPIPPPDSGENVPESSASSNGQRQE